MNVAEYNKISNYKYDEYVKYLIDKYGVVGDDYFTEGFVSNQSIKRRDEELFVHHIREDKVAGLSDVDTAKSAPAEYQHAENLVYANLLEHILLHILIGEQNNGLGFGGAEIMFNQANDFYNSFDGEKESVLGDVLKSEKATNKYLKLWGEDRFNKLVEFMNADNDASGTK